MRALSIGATGMEAQQLNVEVIANNIANLSTTGFKRSRAEFQDLLYQNLRSVGSASSDTGTVVPSGLQVGLGVRPAATYRINSQGTLNTTNNPLDVAVNGLGFFQVQMPDGTTAYTRAGSFQLNSSGQLVTADGYTILPSVTVPSTATAITINSSGQVLASVAGQTAQTTLGQLQLANFVNPAGLESIGNNILKETTASGTPTTGNPNTTNFGTLVQGSLEQSNVDIVSEITDMITAQRAYEMNSKVINTADQMLNTTNQMKA
ncbi:MAG: flagellar basal-body rod protein FlgG [Alphaproteobacteria bacterium]|nr:flagellar basal-body rod protein FlgG [Alphaproteobacteria bacterium]MBV8548482.1 flagellar basal-body rod protein FlgG [Alphaproteobacteria bacterium]